MATRRELALFGADLGDVDTEIAERVGFELALAWRAAPDIRQPGEAVPLQTAVQRGAGQVRKGGLQGIQAVIERQPGMPTESNDDSLVLDGKHGGLGVLWPGWQVCDGATPLPLGDGLLVDAVARSQGYQALLTNPNYG